MLLEMSQILARKKKEAEEVERQMRTVATRRPRHKVVDHLGREYPTFSLMAKAYGLSVHTLLRRLSKGMTLEQALTRPLRGSEPVGPKLKRVTEVTDHTGHVFLNYREMAEFWGISYKCFRMRISRNWPLDRALTTPARPLRKF